LREFGISGSPSVLPSGIRYVRNPRGGRITSSMRIWPPSAPTRPAWPFGAWYRPSGWSALASTTIVRDPIARSSLREIEDELGRAAARPERHHRDLPALVDPTLALQRQRDAPQLVVDELLGARRPPRAHHPSGRASITGSTSIGLWIRWSSTSSAVGSANARKTAMPTEPDQERRHRAVDGLVRVARGRHQRDEAGRLRLEPHRVEAVLERAELAV
jgi:hypothetical protein